MIAMVRPHSCDGLDCAIGLGPKKCDFMMSTGYGIYSDGLLINGSISAVSANRKGYATAHGVLLASIVATTLRCPAAAPSLSVVEHKHLTRYIDGDFHFYADERSEWGLHIIHGGRSIVLRVQYSPAYTFSSTYWFHIRARRPVFNSQLVPADLASSRPYYPDLLVTCSAEISNLDIRENNLLLWCIAYSPY